MSFIFPELKSIIGPLSVEALSMAIQESFMAICHTASSILTNDLRPIIENRDMLFLVAFSRCFFKYLQFVLIFDREQLKLVAYVFSNNQNKVAKSKIE